MNKLLSITLHSSLLLLTSSLSAAIPQHWTVETSRVQPAQFEGYHGETIEFAATMQSYGKPLAITNDLIGIYWQTNGMGSAYWTAPAEIRFEPSNPPTLQPSNLVFFARWEPSMDVGATVYSCFIGAPGEIYRAAFQLRLRPSPGAVPAELPFPVKTLDFARVEVRNAPYYTKSETDAKIIELAPAPGNYATVSNRAMTAVQPAAISDMETRTHTAATYASKSSLQSLSDTVDSKLDKSGGTMTGDIIFEKGNCPQAQYFAIQDEGHRTLIWTTGISIDDFSIDINFPDESGTLALISDIPDVSAFADKSTVEALADNVSTWSSFWSGDDVRVTVTNYDSAVNLPSLYLEYKLSNGLFRTVWDERTRWDINDRRMAAAESAIEGKADRAWGYYDSHTGGWAPDGYTWLSSPKIAISGGLAYQKHVTSEGAVWVLESNGLVSETGGSVSNGFFRISDDEGNPLFEIVKGDKRTVGATAGSCEPLAGYAITHLQIGYAVESADHPKIYVTRSLTPVDWKAEDDADCPATVSWSGSSGNWTAVVAGKVAEAQLFVKAEYEVGGNTYINQSAPVSVQKLVLGGQEYRVGTATISGHTVLTLTLEP